MKYTESQVLSLENKFLRSVRIAECPAKISHLNQSGCSGSHTKRLLFSHRRVCVSDHAVPPPPAAWLPRPQSLHLPAWSVPLLFYCQWVFMAETVNSSLEWKANCKITQLGVLYLMYMTDRIFCVSCRVHSWRRDSPSETAGTCQPTVRLHRRSKKWSSSLLLIYKSFITKGSQSRWLRHTS